MNGLGLLIIIAIVALILLWFISYFFGFWSENQFDTTGIDAFP